MPLSEPRMFAGLTIILQRRFMNSLFDKDFSPVLSSNNTIILVQTLNPNAFFFFGFAEKNI